ncbi:hypothetical protein AKL17_3p0030 (plasmid) [Frigidibacter mobilis]|uniref:DUF1403 family protein n=2 Tax=Frigidibacter mobilis TaxID=1335048 RepID=A0A159Z9D2_9RHOB|nr:hypothetical protein AKL17_3p0030 [Frigidibacter mobilis]
MKSPALAPADLVTLPRLPGWIIAGPAQSPEDVAFSAGAALVHLDLLARTDTLPTALWRERLALAAAEACAGFAGRRETSAALRDALHLTRPGDHPGPAGEIALHWCRAAERPLSAANLARGLPGITAERIALCLGAEGSPVARAAAVLEAVLTDAPRAETEALILADAALARAAGWAHLLPLLATGLKPRDLRLRGGDLQLACHRALIAAARPAAQLAADLTRRAGRLREVAPKLRARGADQAVALFLSRDALAPAELTAFMSDRAARRLCDRLVALGALRELTGRDTFRLYGL